MNAFVTRKHLTRPTKGPTARSVAPSAVIAVTEEILRRIEAGEFEAEGRVPLNRLRFDPRSFSVWRVLLRQKNSGEFRRPVGIAGLNPLSIPIKNIIARCKILKQIGDRESLAEHKRLTKTLSDYRLKQKNTDRCLSKCSAAHRQGLACSYLLFVAFRLALDALGILSIPDLKISDSLMNFAGIEPFVVPADVSRFESARQVLEAVGGKQPRKVVTKADLRLAADYLESTAADLGRLARISSLLLEGAPVEVAETVTALRRKAKSFLSMDNSKLRVIRRGRDDELRSFIIKLDETFCSLFGSSMYGTAAKLANVALGREDISGKKVRALLRDRSAK
jgi:hypothetical protein